jgi:ABC-type spermidine/putrescine transport system permease subunit II
LAFLASLDELVMALFLGGTSTRTLQMQMWQGMRFESDPTVAAVSSLLIMMTVLVFWSVLVSRRRLQR